MDIGANQIVTQIASSTSDYLVVYLPVFVLIGGIVLAFVFIEYLLSFFRQASDSIGAQPGYAPTDQMVNNPNASFTKADRDYYRSRYYPGSDKFVGFESQEYKNYARED